MNEDGNLVLNILVPWVQVKKVYDQILELAIAEVEVEGFRKGKAPRDLALKKIDTGKIYGEVVNQILPKAYADEIEKRNLKPIISPKVQIVATEENKDWEFKATTAEKPVIDLGDYKGSIKSAKIWKPGDDVKEETAENRSKRINEIITKLLETAKIKIPQILADDEADRMLTQLIDDIRSAGLTFEQYCHSKGVTAEQIKSQYHTQAEAALKLEFILGEIAEKENLSVGQEEIEAVINKEKDEAGKESLRKQSYLLASILRREKTLTFLANL
jgi:trigger factor